LMEIETDEVADLMFLDVNNLDGLTSTHYKRCPFSSGNHYVFSLRHSTSLLWRLLVDGAAFFFLPLSRRPRGVDPNAAPRAVRPVHWPPPRPGRLESCPPLPRADDDQPLKHRPPHRQLQR